jgi:hypothetical protein
LNAGGSREQKHASADDNYSDGSRDALAGWSEPLGSDGCRHDGRDAQVHDAMTSRIAVRPALQQLQWRSSRMPCRQAVPASAGNVRARESRQQAR